MLATDAKAEFRCGLHALDDYFARHAAGNATAWPQRMFVSLAVVRLAAAR